MIGDMKGIAMISQQVINRSRVYMGGLEKYEGRLCTVMDRNDSGDCLVLAPDGFAGMGDFMAVDVMCFLPVTKKNGVIMPVFEQPAFMEESRWFMKAMQMGTEAHNLAYGMKCIQYQKIITDVNYEDYTE